MQPLQYVLSISTAGKNRYLLHFNSLHSLTQWTAGIRLAMFEHSSLQEAYTGSLIAGKGKFLNNIRVIMERNRFKQEDWARVRFGAGTPWRRCWCVISPPEEKEYLKQQKQLKKRSVYERAPALKGDIKFYDTKKVTKKTKPIATITDAFSAYAIYPQSKPLIDQSTLVKLEGKITIHAQPDTTTEGFVFVMPEIHPAITGFEMMLRWLFPVMDTFALYGRPTRLVPDTLDTRSLMFAFPQERKYGYLEILDVAGLIHTVGSQSWSEREWRQQLKDLTARRILNKAPSRSSSKNGVNLQSRTATMRHNDAESIRSHTSAQQEFARSTDAFNGPPRASTDLNGSPRNSHGYHSRSRSEVTSNGIATPPRRQRAGTFTGQPSDITEDPSEHRLDTPPTPPRHGVKNGAAALGISHDSQSSEEDVQALPTPIPAELEQAMRPMSPPQPVQAPPAFSHQPNDRPSSKWRQSPELTRHTHRMSNATLAQMYDARQGSPANGIATAGAAAAWNRSRTGTPTDDGQRGVISTDSNGGPYTDKQPGFEGDALDASPTTQHQHSRSGSSVSSQIMSDAGFSRSAASLSGASGQLAMIARKPVGQSAGNEPERPSNLRNVIDRTELAHLMGKANLAGSASERTGSNNETPEFVSARQSSDSNRSAGYDKPRMGVLKTVGGDSDGGSQTQKDELSGADLPTIDFGPTPALNPLQKSLPTAYRRDEVDIESAPSTPEKRVSSYQAHSRSPSRSPLHDAEDGRSVAWQPGTQINRPNHTRTLTPDEFVHQRTVSRKAVPIYSQQPRASSTTPPRSRTPSGEWSKNQARFSHKELPPRPSSRGAASVMDNPPPRPRSSGAGASLGDPIPRPYSRGSNLDLGSKGTGVGSRMSAREQEHMSRMAGTPLIAFAGRQNESQSGLVGAIGQQERERQEMRAGISGHLADESIAQRRLSHQQSAPFSGYPAGQPMYVQPGNPYQENRFSNSQPSLTSPQAWDTYVKRQSMMGAADGYGLTAQQQRELEQKYGGYYNPHA